MRCVEGAAGRLHCAYRRRLRLCPIAYDVLAPGRGKERVQRSRDQGACTGGSNKQLMSGQDADEGIQIEEAFASRGFGVAEVSVSLIGQSTPARTGTQIDHRTAPQSSDISSSATRELGVESCTIRSWNSRKPAQAQKLARVDAPHFPQRCEPRGAQRKAEEFSADGFGKTLQRVFGCLAPAELHALRVVARSLGSGRRASDDALECPNSSSFGSATTRAARGARARVHYLPNRVPNRVPNRASRLWYPRLTTDRAGAGER